MIETERLLLRPLEAGDAAYVIDLVNDPAFIANIGDRGIRDEAGAIEQIETWAAGGRPIGAGNNVVIDRATGRRVGNCGLLKRDFLDAPDLGYAFLPEGRARGYALEACRAVLADARDRLGIRRVLAMVNPDNARSIVVLDRLGFVTAGDRVLPDGKRVLIMERTEPDAG